MSNITHDIETKVTDFEIDGSACSFDTLTDAFTPLQMKVGQTVKVRRFGRILLAIYRRVDLRRKPTDRYGEPLTWPYVSECSVISG